MNQYRSKLRSFSIFSILSFFMFPLLVLFFQNCSSSSGGQAGGSGNTKANEAGPVKLDEKVVGRFVFGENTLLITSLGSVSFIGPAVCGADYDILVNGTSQKQFKTFPCTCQWSGNVTDVMPGPKGTQTLVFNVGTNIDTAATDSKKMASSASDPRVVSDYCFEPRAAGYAVDYLVNSEGCIEFASPYNGTFCAGGKTGDPAVIPGLYQMINNTCYQLVNGQYVPQADSSLCTTETGTSPSYVSQVCTGPHTDGLQWVNCGAEFNCAGYTLYNQQGQIVKCQAPPPPPTGSNKYYDFNRIFHQSSSGISTVTGDMTIVNSDAYKVFLKEAMGVCDRTVIGLDGGLSNCDNWVSGSFQIALSIDANLKPSVSFTAQPGASFFGTYVALGIDGGGAAFNPLVLSQNNTFSLINNSQGFEIRAQGTYWNGGGLRLIQIQVLQGTLNDGYFAYDIYYPYNNVATKIASGKLKKY